MEKKAAKRSRIVLVPFPLQGHITPMMQLGQALNSKGFSITVALTELHLVSSLQHFPGFQFVNIPEIVPVAQCETLGLAGFTRKLNKTSEGSFKDCIAQLLQQQGNDIFCIIHDELMYFSKAVAKEFKLPSVIFSICSATNQACWWALSKVNIDKFLIDMEDPEVQVKELENLHPLRYKDLPSSKKGPLKEFLELFKEICNERTTSAIVLNTASCLESLSLSWLQPQLSIPVYSLGPLHVTASQSSSLLEQDRSCIEWLNKQKPKSVIYISFGSLVTMEHKEVLEIAWGLCNSNQPFLWVIRPGSILGSETLPEEVSTMVSGRGYIVKWAPQTQVLGHPAVGGFWSHCGWNSTLESIVEGVPMLCRPDFGDQKFNAVCIESVWRVGIQLQGEVERGGVERAVKRLMLDDEGVGMRERALALKEKLKASVRIGGSSYAALEELVNYLETEQTTE